MAQPLANVVFASASLRLTGLGPARAGHVQASAQGRADVQRLYLQVQPFWRGHAVS
jgi:hypothetical protein